MMIQKPARTLATVLLALPLAGLATHTAAASPAPVPEVDWETSINHFQFDSEKFIGQRLSVACPGLTARDTMPDIYGTDVYPSKTPICTAARHAGRIDAAGGTVTVQLNPGASEYLGSTRNDVASADLPATDRSIVFVDGPGSDGTDATRLSWLPRLKWDTKFTATGLANRKLVGQQFTFNCPRAPEDMRPRRLVGTDSYAFHSMVCRAAVHAGSITTEGGLVTVRMDPGKRKLVGSIRNGVESSDGSGGHTTLSFVAAAR